MKNSFAIALCILTRYLCFAQTNVNCEKQWMIDFYFKSEKNIHQQLNNVYDLTLTGKYADAHKIIHDIKNKSNSDLSKAAAISYEAILCYNESKYEKSIVLSDSVLNLLANEKNNRYSLKALNNKAKAFAAINEYDRAQKILDSVIIIATKNKDLYNLAGAYYLYGSIYSDKGFIEKSIQAFNKSVEIRTSINDEHGLAACYSFLGLSQSHLGNYALGIDYIQKSIQIREKIKDKRGLANSYLSLYKIYLEIGEEDKARESELKSLDICKDIGDLQCVSGRLTNLGQLLQKKGEYDNALTYHFLALTISKQLNIKNRIALVHENIARVYNHTHKYDDAIKHIDSSIVIRTQIGEEEGLVSSYVVLAKIYLNQQNYKQSVSFGQRAFDFGKKLELPYLIKEAHEVLSKAYSKLNQHEKAFQHYKDFIVLRDSLYNIDKTKEIVRKELEFNFKKAQELERLEQQKITEQAEQESKKQKMIILASTLAVVILSGLLIFAIWQYRLKIKSEKQLEYSNNELYFKNKELSEKSTIIEAQHNTIHLKNKEITDSIHYAKKIQTAIMPLKQEFINYFKEAFVLFEPKDIISGDFYWVTKKNDKIIYVTGDCTGHGVPGGFMSMLGVSLLNEIINEHDLTEPSLILSRLRKKVIHALKQKGLSGEQQDGMDMTLCVIDKSTSTLHYSAANHFFYIVNKNKKELKEYKGDKQPVGIFGNDLKPFKQYDVQLENGDVIYSFTDGLADQFGGPKGKKFKYTQLKELLLSIQDLSMEQQENEIKKRFYEWKGDLEQVDDVCMIGIKV